MDIGKSPMRHDVDVAHLSLMPTFTSGTGETRPADTLIASWFESSHSSCLEMNCRTSLLSVYCTEGLQSLSASEESVLAPLLQHLMMPFSV